MIEILQHGYSLGIAPPVAMFRPSSRITVASIMGVVADYYGIPLYEMTSARRSREVARPRQVAMYLARELTPKSLPDIGMRFGGRDHTTVMHALRRIDRLIQEDAEIAEDVDVLRFKLKGNDRTFLPVASMAFAA